MKQGIFDENGSDLDIGNLNPFSFYPNFDITESIAPIDLGDIIKLPTIKTEIKTDTSLGIKLILGFIGLGFFLSYIKK